MQSSHIDGEIVGALIPDLAVLHSEDASRAAVGREKHRCSLDPLGGGFRSRRASMPAGALLLSAVIAIQLDRMNARVFGDGWIGAQACMWVNKFHEESTVTALSPVVRSRRARSRGIQRRCNRRTCASPRADRAMSPQPPSFSDDGLDPSSETCT